MVKPCEIDFNISDQGVISHAFTSTKCALSGKPCLNEECHYDTDTINAIKKIESSA